MQTPSTKVTVQFGIGLALAVALAVGQDAAVIDLLPDWARVILGPVVAAVAAYIKTETNPPRPPLGE